MVFVILHGFMLMFHVVLKWPPKVEIHINHLNIYTAQWDENITEVEFTFYFMLLRFQGRQTFFKSSNKVWKVKSKYVVPSKKNMIKLKYDFKYALTTFWTCKIDKKFDTVVEVQRSIHSFFWE